MRILRLVVNTDKALQMISKTGALLGTLDALSVLTNTGLGRLGFSNARFFELVDSAFEPVRRLSRPASGFSVFECLEPFDFRYFCCLAYGV